MSWSDPTQHSISGDSGCGEGGGDGCAWCYCGPQPEASRALPDQVTRASSLASATLQMQQNLGPKSNRGVEPDQLPTLPLCIPTAACPASCTRRSTSDHLASPRCKDAWSSLQRLHVLGLHLWEDLGCQVARLARQSKSAAPLPPPPPSSDCSPWDSRHCHRRCTVHQQALSLPVSLKGLGVSRKIKSYAQRNAQKRAL